MKKKTTILIILIGIILTCIGLFLQVPSKELTTYSILEGEGYSVIEEYVGGDAYNFIIGAALVGGEIAGIKTQKAVFISVGLLIICIGLVMHALWYVEVPKEEPKTPNVLMHKESSPFDDSATSHLHTSKDVQQTAQVVESREEESQETTPNQNTRTAWEEDMKRRFNHP